MKTGRYSLGELFTHNEIEQIIIPEIQRDYVWTGKNVRKLLESIISHFEKKEESKFELEISGLEIINTSIKTHLQKEYDRLVNNLKLGFVYAYHDNQYAGKFFLIDGQQRFTTLYLLLLAIYVMNNEREKFKEKYFKDEVLKVDYKVRENSHDFMLTFVKNQLEDTPKGIKFSKDYYKYEYDEDETINNLIGNYSEIQNVLNNNKIKILRDGSLNNFIEYLEDYIEVNYFDTNLSRQGEQLYLYMNSRGEFLSAQELLKAEIIRKSEKIEEKKRIGKIWEDWQNFFWIYRCDEKGGNENADIGFEEYLKWATVIHICSTDAIELEGEGFQDTQKAISIREKKESYIRISEKEKAQKEALFNYQIKNINADYLEKIFEAINFLKNSNSQYLPINPKWLFSINGVIDYVIILPLIYYISTNDWLDDITKKRDVERMAMFLKNLTYFESVSKNPDAFTIQAIELVKELLTIGEKDIINLLNQDLAIKFPTLITEPEKFKLKLYKNAGENREKIEKKVWDIVNNEHFSSFFKGNISILFETINEKESNYNLPLNPTLSEINLLNEYYTILSSLIINYKLNSKNAKESDVFRRALLTFGDYLVDVSGSYKFGDRIPVFSFGSYYDRDNREWTDIFIKSRVIISDFLFTIKSREISDLNTFIDDYNQDDWKAPFIKNKNLLGYCENKRILWQNESRILLIKYKETGYIEIQCYILQELLGDRIKIPHHNICEFEISTDGNNKLPSNQYQYYINLKYTDSKWFYSVGQKNSEQSATNFQAFINKGWLLDSNDLFVKKDNNILYEDVESLSITDNVENLKIILEKEYDIIMSIISNK